MMRTTAKDTQQHWDGRRNSVCKSFETEQEWMNDSVFPAGEKFTEEFIVSQETNATGYKKMVLYMMVVYKKPWHMIKHHYIVMNHLKTNNIWVKIDEYDTKKAEIQDVDCNEKQILAEWKKKNIAVDQEYNKIPKFCLLYQYKQWGENPNCIEAPVVHIQSVAEDSGYLKTLQSAVYGEKFINQGIFITQGMINIAGEEVHKQALRKQNEYIPSMMSIAIVGMHQDALQAEVNINEEGIMLEQYFNHVNPHIKTVMKTKQTEETGRWLIVLDADKVEAYNHPTRTIASGNKTVGTYADMLKKQYTNTSYQQQTWNKQHDAAPMTCPNKQIM
eukprot:5752183-Ditylum_brightwellii.AAC.1